MASLTRWTWVWVNSGSWRGQEGLAVCSPWGRRVRHDWTGGSLSSFQIATVRLCPHMASSRCRSVERAPSGVFACKTRPIRSGPLKPHLTLLLKESHLQSQPCWELGLQHMNLGCGNPNIQPIIKELHCTSLSFSECLLRPKELNRLHF